LFKCKFINTTACIIYFYLIYIIRYKVHIRLLTIVIIEVDSIIWDRTFISSFIIVITTIIYTIWIPVRISIYFDIIRVTVTTMKLIISFLNTKSSPNILEYEISLYFNITTCKICTIDIISFTFIESIIIGFREYFIKCISFLLF